VAVRARTLAHERRAMVTAIGGVGVTSFAAQMLMTHAYGKFTVPEAADLAQLTPVASYLWALALLDERLAPLGILGVGLGVTGVGLRLSTGPEGNSTGRTPCRRVRVGNSNRRPPDRQQHPESLRAVSHRHSDSLYRT